VLCCLSSCLDAVKVDDGFQDYDKRSESSLSMPTFLISVEQSCADSEAVYISRIHPYMEALWDLQTTKPEHCVSHWSTY
jgi:hypothetical protein